MEKKKYMIKPIDTDTALVSVPNPLMINKYSNETRSRDELWA